MLTIVDTTHPTGNYSAQKAMHWAGRSRSDNRHQVMFAGIVEAQGSMPDSVGRRLDVDGGAQPARAQLMWPVQLRRTGDAGSDDGISSGCADRAELLVAEARIMAGPAGMLMKPDALIETHDAELFFTALALPLST